MDFFVVPTVTCRLLYVLVVITHERRKIIHFNITAAPTAEWTAQQVVNAFPYDTLPKYLLRDRGFDLRIRVREAGQRHGHPAEVDLPEISLAEPLRGAPGGFNSARMPGSSDRVQ